jgi:hypothetical protein
VNKGKVRITSILDRPTANNFRSERIAEKSFKLAFITDRSPSTSTPSPEGLCCPNSCWKILAGYVNAGKPLSAILRSAKTDAQITEGNMVTLFPPFL